MKNSCQHFDRGRFARPIRANEGDCLPTWDIQADPIHSDHISLLTMLPPTSAEGKGFVEVIDVYGNHDPNFRKKP
ncbi:hypothetical protein AM10699_58910 (plasmid) [Acaryochloris marina MBIC10699]|nr:hypothetical protein AM10699_58910 [Acaryochloris marina MBIC10699]